MARSMIRQLRQSGGGLALTLLLVLALLLVASLALNPKSRAAGYRNGAIAPQPAEATAIELVATDSFVATDSLDAIASFAAFALEPNGDPDGSAERSYVIIGLHKLAYALDAVAVRATADATNAQKTSASLHRLADSLTVNSSDDRYASILRTSFIETADGLADIQRRRYPHLKLAAAEMHNAVRLLSVERPVSEQAKAISRYFERASDLIRAMGL